MRRSRSPRVPSVPWEHGEQRKRSKYVLPVAQRALGGPPENELGGPSMAPKGAWRPGPCVPGSTPSGPVTSPVALPQAGLRVAGWRSPCWTAPSLPVTRSRQVAVPGPRFHPVASFSLRAACFHLPNGARKLGDAAGRRAGAGAQGVDAQAARWTRALPERRGACGELCL